MCDWYVYVVFSKNSCLLLINMHLLHCMCYFLSLPLWLNQGLLSDAQWQSQAFGRKHPRTCSLSCRLYGTTLAPSEHGVKCRCKRAPSLAFNRYLPAAEPGMGAWLDNLFQSGEENKRSFIGWGQRIRWDSNAFNQKVWDDSAMWRYWLQVVYKLG